MATASRRKRGSLVRTPKIYQYKTKGHRVIAMPLCLTDLAPPAFTAPCRNQINERCHLLSQGTYRLFSSENRVFRWLWRAGSDDFVARLTVLSRRLAGCP